MKDKHIKEILEAAENIYKNSGGAYALEDEIELSTEVFKAEGGFWVKAFVWVPSNKKGTRPSY